MKSLLKAALLCLISTGAFALSSDSEQPVYIDSDSQKLDMKSNEVTFEGDVKLVQGSIELEADKVIVVRDAVTGTITSIQSFGEPTTFRQETDEGKELRGQALELFYSMSNNQLLMTKQAQLMQDDSVIKGETIRYQIDTETMLADGGNGNRVSTVLQPQAQKGQ
jgi:lipopolysaccharide export system protein LptA